MINMVLGSEFSPGLTASDSVLVLSRFFLFSPFPKFLDSQFSKDCSSGNR